MRHEAGCGLSDPCWRLRPQRSRLSLNLRLEIDRKTSDFEAVGRSYEKTKWQPKDIFGAGFTRGGGGVERSVRHLASRFEKTLFPN